MLEQAFETFARQWATQLTEKVRVLAQVTCERVNILSYDAYAASLPQVTAMVLCAVPGSAARAVIQFPMSAALDWVGHMLGGSGNQAAPDRQFTRIEQALIRQLMDHALDDLDYSLGHLLADGIRVDTIEYNSQFAQAAGTGDLMIVASFSIGVGERSAPATVAIPAAAILPQLGETGPVTSITGATTMMQAQLARVPVEVSVHLNPATVTPSDILGLAVGDIVSLPHPRHRAFHVSVDGCRLANAAVGATGSRLAGVIVDPKETP